MSAPATPRPHHIAPGDAARAGAAKRPWLVLAAVTVPLFLLMVDFYGIVVALPSIGDDLGGSTGQLGWVMNAFAIGSSAPVLALGRLADLWGRKKIVLIGIVAFAGCSLLAAVAPTLPVLILARFLAGVSGSMFFSASLAIVSAAFDDDRRPTAIGVWGGVGGIGSAVGPLLGGVITEALSWRWLFGLNVPFLLAAAVLVAVEVPESRDETASGVDWKGFAVVTAGLVALVVGMQQAVDLGLGSPQVIACLVAAALLLVGFVRLERRVAEPLVDLDLFKRGDYAGPASIAFLANWAFGVVMFFLTLYLQQIVGDDAARTGGTFVLYSLPFAVVGGFSGLLARRLGARPLLAAGMGLCAAGAVVLAGIDSADPGQLVAIGLLVTGVGQGLAFNLSTSEAMGAVPQDKAGVASGMVNTVRMVGYSAGVALTSVLVTAVEADTLTSAASDRGLDLTASEVATAQEAVSGSQDALHSLMAATGANAATVADVITEAFTTGLRAGMLLTAAVAAIGVPIALAVRSRRPPAG